ncbi:MAG: AmmeMemoRadiSam system radical SAM enzyme, partial [Actinomycetia bacterium]|nr:AmmeMemoRadiSam system radical SAM enzyme [Actinomycetes bacterium]
CRFCQNWEISTARSFDALTDSAGPEHIAEAAVRAGCRGVAYTYNDPIVFAEYAIDVAAAVHAAGLLNIAVTAGSINQEPRADFFAGMDAANVDLKSFDASFYHRVCGGRLEVVLDTLRYLARETSCWVEVTTLVIPGYNDSDAELGALAAWLVTELGPDVPWHVTAFHPDNRMRDVPRTPLATLRRARWIGLAAGLRFVYTGNVVDRDGATTRCPGCGARLIERDGYDIVAYGVTPDGRCRACGADVPGRWDAHAGGFGSRRRALRLHA